MKVSVKEITPDMARALLANKKENRDVRRTAVLRYASDMAAGKWILNGESIILNGDGALIQGQHRLEACIHAGVSFETVFVEGADAKAMATLDSGLGRSVADHLHFLGIPNKATVSAAAAFAMRYDQMVESDLFQLAAAQFITRQNQIAFVLKNSPIVDSAGFAVEHRKRIACVPSLVAGVHFLITRKASAEQADRFWADVADGSAEEGSAQMLLRQYFLDRQTRFSMPPMQVRAALAVKAARFFLNPDLEVPTRLIWKHKGQHREGFPRL